MNGRFNIVITNIHYVFGTRIPLMLEITIFNQLGTEQFKFLMPASLCKGSLEEKQELVLVPKDQVSLKENV